MAGHRGGGRKRAHFEEEHENEERWLVSFADMMTLLFCLFMVLFAISSVNTSKFESLQKALQDAFSGRILSGGKAIIETGNDVPPERAQATPPMPAISPLTALQDDAQPKDDSEKQAAAQKEQEDFKALKKRIDDLARKSGLKGRVVTTVRDRGLVVQLITDKVFFDSGRADLKPGAIHILDSIGGVLESERKHPIVVEGHTDSQPISGGGTYPSNWELSGARSAAVVRVFVHTGVLPRRLSLAGYADEIPVATNTTAQGRSRNRRVEVVLTRIYGAAGQGRQP
jgi:chemotaxis protein MotB